MPQRLVYIKIIAVRARYMPRSRSCCNALGPSAVSGVAHQTWKKQVIVRVEVAFVV